MKRYKLLKDLPFAKAGEIVEIWGDGTIDFTNNPSLSRFNKSDIDMFSLWFEEIKTYYLVDEYAQICEVDIRGTSVQKSAKAIGNCFETEQEAKKHLEWLKARAILLKDTTRNGMFNVCHNSVVGFMIVRTADVWSEMMFKTEEDAKKSIDSHTKEWKIYLGVE